MPVTLQIAGLDGLNQQLARLADQSYRTAAEALREEAEVMMTEAKRRTPVKYGVLRGSGMVTGPDVEGVVKLSFGGDAKDYAIFVHENLEAHHRVGQAKFLESVVLEAEPHLAARVAEGMRRKAGL